MIPIKILPCNIPVGFHFNVKIMGITNEDDCRFQDIGGLNVSFDTETHIEGGNNAFIWKLPTRAKYENIILKRGVLKNSTLVNDWIKDAISNFKFSPKQVDISLLDDLNLPAVSWSLFNAYPISIKISEFKAMENSIAIETLELCYNYFTRTS